jgi:hypothetical protein
MKGRSPRIQPWLLKPRPPIFPPINIILEVDSKGTFTDDALLYQGILKYGLEHSRGFIFTDLGNWLIKNLLQYRNYYTDSKSHIPKSARLANRRQIIQAHLDNLTRMELIYKKSMTKAQKNREDIPSFDLTVEGRFLAWIMEARDPNKSTDLMWTVKAIKTREIYKPDEIRLKASREVFTIIDSFTSSKDSCILMFLNKFFELSSNYFPEYIDLFYYFDLRHIEMAKGQELLRLFTKTRHTLNWIYANPKIFVETLDEIRDEETKKLMFFQFKLEIEEYYNKYYLMSYVTRHSNLSHYSSSMSISGRGWQLMRFNNMANYNKVVIPGLCESCKSENPFVLAISDYLTCLINYALHPLSPSSNVIRSNCTHCNKERSVITEPYIALDMVRGHEKL